MAKKNERPTDVNQRAKNIVDIATGEVTETKEEKDAIKAAASALGRKGGLKGGKARTECRFRSMLTHHSETC